MTSSRKSKRGRTGDGKESFSTKRARLPIGQQVAEECQCCAFHLHKQHNKNEPPPSFNDPDENRFALILSGKLPNVLRWARKHLDERGKNSASASQEAVNASSTAEQKRKCIGEVIARKDVLLDMENSKKLWSGDVRFWTNVFVLAEKLPPKEKVLNVLDAMNRYPSSVLVHTGVQEMFGTVRKYSKKRVHVALPRPNVFSVFDNFTASGHPTSLWFEFDTYGRLQEIAIHTTSVAEYVLCCARQARMANNSAEETQAAFLKSLDEDIQVCQDENSSGVILMSPNVNTDNMEAEAASQCLQQAIQVAHTAVLKGLARAGRKYGLKRTKSTPRQKVQLWMMRRVFPEVMDTTISALKDTISQIMGGTSEEVVLDMDIVEVYLTRILRGMEKLYVDIGDRYFMEQFKSKETALNKNLQRLLCSTPYKYTEPS